MREGDCGTDQGGNSCGSARLFALLVATALGAVVYFALAPTAGADPPVREPFVNIGGTIPAGVACAGFPVTVSIDVDDQQTATTFFDKDGNPTRQMSRAARSDGDQRLDLRVAHVQASAARFTS